MPKEPPAITIVREAKLPPTNKKLFFFFFDSVLKAQNLTMEDVMRGKPMEGLRSLNTVNERNVFYVFNECFNWSNTEKLLAEYHHDSSLRNYHGGICSFLSLLHSITSCNKNVTVESLMEHQNSQLHYLTKEFLLSDNHPPVFKEMFKIIRSDGGMLSSSSKLLLIAYRK